MTENILKTMLDETNKKKAKTATFSFEIPDDDIIWGFTKEEEKKPVNKTEEQAETKRNGKEPEPSQKTILIAFTNNDPTTAEVVSGSGGVRPTEEVNSLLVALCRRAAGVMGLDFEDLFTKMANALLGAIYEATTEDIFRLMGID